MDANKTQALSSDPNRTQMGAPPTLDPNRTIMGTAPSLNATQTIKPVQCPVCKSFNPAGMMFCNECGLIFELALDGDAFGAPAVQLPVLVDGSGREHPIRPGENVVGREGDIALVDSMVSRRHAKVTMQDDVISVEDLGSTNGTKVNGETIPAGTSVTLTAGDKVSFGGVECALSMPGVAAATMMPVSNKTAAIAAAPSISPHVAKLIGDEATFGLKSGENSFGRKSENDLVISDPYVSGKHGVIEVAEDGVFLTDLDSTNGTFLNDSRLAANVRTKITEDDSIRFGGQLTFRLAMGG